MKTQIEEVIKTLQAEFEYSKRWDASRREKGEPEHKMDSNKPVEFWISTAKHFLLAARTEAAKSSDKTAALHEMRKVANLAIACLAYQGCPERK